MSIPRMPKTQKSIGRRTSARPTFAQRSRQAEPARGERRTAIDQEGGSLPSWKGASVAGLLAALFALACQTQAQFLTSKQPTALETALTRARFEMNCPDAKGEVLSSEVVQPALQGPYVSGVQRGEFTIGVAGCGQRNTYVVVCPEGGEGCFALDSAAARQR